MLGDRSAQTFKPLWQIVHCWHSYFYVTDGYKVYQSFINDVDQIVDKTYMTRVEGENTRLRHYLARVASQNFVLLQISRYAEVLSSLATLLPEISNAARTNLIHPSIKQRPHLGHSLVSSNRFTIDGGGDDVSDFVAAGAA